MAPVKKVKTSKSEKQKVLFKKSIYYISFSLFFSFISFFSYFYVAKYNKQYENKLKDLYTRKDNADKRLKEIEAKIAIAERMKNIKNQKIDQQLKNKTEINNEYINGLINQLKKNNYIYDINTTFSPINNYSINIYDKNIKTFSQEININLKCLSEHTVYNFIDDFKKFFIGFAIVDNFEIKRVKNLDKTFVKNMANGKMDYLFEANLLMHLYYVKLW